MTQIAEPVLIGMFDQAINAEDKCDPESKYQGEARINKNIGTHSDCDAQRLYKAMEASKNDRGYRAGDKEPFVAKSNTDQPWELSRCSENAFPLQAHHIIPKNFLPTHIVCAFLAKKCDDHPDVKLKADTDYDTDHAYNGYNLPYATPLKEWEKANTPEKKDDVALELMKLTKRQLHQGSHKFYQYGPEPSVPEEEDDGDVGHSDGVGYLAKIEFLLDIVAFAALEHVNVCKVCKKDAAKREISPRENVVKFVHQVSGITKVLMDANRIFVSERAYKAYIASKTNPEIPAWLQVK
jgi:hypothetical protein